MPVLAIPALSALWRHGEFVAKLLPPGFSCVCVCVFDRFRMQTRRRMLLLVVDATVWKESDSVPTVHHRQVTNRINNLALLPRTEVVIDCLCLPEYGASPEADCQYWLLLGYARPTRKAISRSRVFRAFQAKD